MDEKSMKISRKWFIQAKKENIESVYAFKPEKDVTRVNYY